MQRSRLGIYLGGTFALTWGCWWGAVLLGRSGMLPVGTAAFTALVLLGGVAPTLAGYGSVLATGGRPALREFNSRVFRWKLSPGWFVTAGLLPFAVAFAATALSGLGARDAPALDLKPWTALLPLFVMMVFGGGLEEPGWRGVALPELRRRWSPLTASGILAPIWVAWHLPLFFLPGIAQYGASVAVFAMGTLGLTLLLTWLYERTRSVLPCVLLHAAGNTAGAMGLPYLLAHRGDRLPPTIASALLLLTGLALTRLALPRPRVATTETVAAAERPAGVAAGPAAPGRVTSA